MSDESKAKAEALARRLVRMAQARYQQVYAEIHCGRGRAVIESDELLYGGEAVRRTPSLEAPMPRKPHRPNPSSFRLSGVDAEAKSGIHWDGVDPANLLVYEPTAKQEIPKKGSWVMITRKLPPIEGGIEADVRVGRIFYARHHEDADAQGFRPNGMYAVRITTPGRDAEQGRDLTILPYEYSTIGLADILSMWTAGEITFHPRNLDQARLNSIVFYARSRGIPLADSMVMALGTLDGDVGWFEPEETLAGDCEALEERVHRWKAKRTLKAPMTIVLGVTNA